jgi:hypothetical protein
MAFVRQCAGKKPSLAFSDALDIAGYQPRSALDDLKLHRNTGPDRAVALAGERREVEEDVLA